MAADYLVPWLKAAGQDGLRNSMMVAQGDNVTKTYTFNFAGGYISKDHVKAYVYDTVAGTTTPQVITPAMWTGPSQLTFGSAFPATQYLVIYRDTPKDKPLLSFKNGSIMNEPNLDEMAEQSVFSAAETQDRFDLVNDGSSLAINNAATALAQSNKAIVDSAQATITSHAAESTAAAAKSVADAASTTANAARDTANGIDAKATDALSNSNSAVTTANAASDTANGIDAKATKAQSDAAAAVVTANAASDTANAAKATADGVDAKAQSALDKSNNAVQKSGDTMTGNLTVPFLSVSNATGYAGVQISANGYGPRIQTDKSSSLIGFVNGANNAWNLKVFDGGQVSTRSNLTVGGDVYAGGTNATIAPDGNVWGTMWGGWLSAWLANNKASRSGDTFTGRVNLNGAGWQADFGLHNNRPGYDSWVYLRSRDGGGLEIINSAYNGVPWSCDNNGQTWQNGTLNVGSGRLQTDGNLWQAYRGRFLSDDMGKLDDAWNKANDAQVNRADRYAQCPIVALEEQGPISIHNGQATWLRRDSPWVLNGIAFAGGQYAWARFAWLRNN
ncbi:hypothetical protein BGV57_26160 [Burkholderia ubonensis]|uniref:phage tail fiber domain-containing protein n=1 Tax=Burkholderia ubonensis TaxID=101571 RepID=UPI0008FD9FCD|nr:phage tail fiber protein [Burkholderia ubonensis]OJB36542.1 hypothetical protein BGV57_26160 [Burkholderia ubonensis]